MDTQMGTFFEFNYTDSMEQFRIGRRRLGLDDLRECPSIWTTNSEASRRLRNAEVEATSVYGTL